MRGTSEEIVGAAVQSGDPEFAFIIGDGVEVLVLVKATAVERAEEDANRDTLKRLTVFVGDLAEDDAFADEFENRRRGIGAELKRRGFRSKPGTVVVTGKKAGLAGCERDEAGRHIFKLKAAFGIRKNRREKAGRKAYKGVSHGLGGCGIDDGAAKGTRAGRSGRGGLGRG